jgi:hypothetical protein
MAGFALKRELFIVYCLMYDHPSRVSWIASGSPFSRSTSTQRHAQDCSMSRGSARSMNLPSVFPIFFMVSSFQQWRGRKGNLTQTGTTEGISFSGMKSGVHLFRYIPLVPMKYGPFLKIKSLSALFSKRNT